MAVPPFKYQKMFPMGADDTQYRLLTKDYVSTAEFEGRKILKVDPEGLAVLARNAMRDVSFMLRPAHLKLVAAILEDPQASDNDKSVALTMLRNAEVAAKGKLPFCQDTGTATIIGKKGQSVWTNACDEEYLSKGVYDCYTQENLRYSQNAPLNMWDEVNTGCNLPAQIDLYATDSDKYEFLFIAKGGGSANKTYLYQETKAIITPEKLIPFMVEKMKGLGTAACPPYHIAWVVGGTSAEACLKTVKLASVKYLDSLPTEGNKLGHAFRDVELEKKLLEETRKLGIGAQFGGANFALDVRVIRMPRHGASCPIGLGVSCSADRNMKAKIDENGIWLEQLEPNPGRFIPEKSKKLKTAHAAGDAEGKLQPCKAPGGRGLAQSVQPEAGVGINVRSLKAGRAGHGRGVQHGAVESGIGKQDVGAFAEEIMAYAVLTAQPDRPGHLFAVFGGAEHPGRAADAKAGVL